jgi:hypothetical protein
MFRLICQAFFALLQNFFNGVCRPGRGAQLNPIGGSFRHTAHDCYTSRATSLCGTAADRAATPYGMGFCEVMLELTGRVEQNSPYIPVKIPRTKHLLFPHPCVRI